MEPVFREILFNHLGGRWIHTFKLNFQSEFTKIRYCTVRMPQCDRMCHSCPKVPDYWLEKLGQSHDRGLPGCRGTILHVSLPQGKYPEQRTNIKELLMTWFQRHDSLREKFLIRNLYCAHSKNQDPSTNPVVWNGSAFSLKAIALHRSYIFLCILYIPSKKYIFILPFLIRQRGALNRYYFF
jgi:hypothetical protein